MVPSRCKVGVSSSVDDSNHYGFISDDAQADSATVAEWCQSRGFETMTGLIMPRMHSIEVPQLFLDFVLEFMDGDELKKFPYPWPPTPRPRLVIA